MMIITTSWDDGDARDTRVADLLTRYGMKGTFYVGRDYGEKRLTEDAIRTLAQTHEVGAHALSHPDLPTLSREEKRAEIAGSKAWLESVLGKPVDMFCYPYGRFDAETEEVVREAGFIGARSSQKTMGTVPTDPFALPVTTMAYRAPFGIVQKLTLPFMKEKLANREWEALARKKFEVVREAGGVFHLWGHSWELDKFALWGSLESFLKEIAHQPDTRYLTNGELVDVIFSERGTRE